MASGPTLTFTDATPAQYVRHGAFGEREDSLSPQPSRSPWSKYALWWHSRYFHALVLVERPGARPSQLPFAPACRKARYRHVKLDNSRANPPVRRAEDGTPPLSGRAPPRTPACSPDVPSAESLIV